ncbi:hypothetical protein L0P88_14370 [Muricauda sp. SCSIO 64092]|uniref:hypothetical protein n=1 Tax=Allomuricauda sp. SCSIO 64092 TaxID=2908842 RepID=UPI001FF22410|nr:hypothetical protein [Muricauda sp. SCSIO 64092]UOY05127.1 hypothetical protein L0P88_14370 [Muricauda sp. SCSIO 64092]
MKNIVLLIAAIILSICSYGQIQQSELYGHWKAKKIVKKSPNPELRGVMDGFRNATFSFLENGDFHLTTESKAPTFQMILRMIEGAKWKFDSQEQLIKIGTEEDGYSIMGIYPTRKESIMRFSLDESEMIFEMEKNDLKKVD